MASKATVIIIVFIIVVQESVGEAPEFRILAPPFICPRDNGTAIDKPDNTVVTLQTEAGLDIKFTWTVRWYPLDSPTQRFTLLLWKTVRRLEQKMNGPQVEPGVYVINNSELLPGVKYIFNVTASSPNYEEVTEKVFHIDNIKGDQTLLIERRSDMFSIVLVGGQLSYADIEYVVEAEVTMCYRSQDYYFVWIVESSSGDQVNVSEVKGSRLEIQANTLKAGLSYTIRDGRLGKYRNSLPFQVLHRDLEIYFNIDVLAISVNTAFSLLTNLDMLEYSEDQLLITWEFTHNGENFYGFEFGGQGTLIFSKGLPDIGEYFVLITVGVLDGSATTEATVRIITLPARLPLVQVDLMPRVLNEGSTLLLSANVTDMVPGCSVTWFFLTEQYLFMNSSDDCGENDIQTPNWNVSKVTVLLRFPADFTSSEERKRTYFRPSVTKHGIQISESVTFHSLEENFLSELTDYTNETIWKSLEAELEAAAGRARIVADCSCTLNMNCSSDGVVYADVNFKVNSKPESRNVMVSPEIGTAMETMFHLSTLAVVDPNRPLRYNFYCSINDNVNLVLGSYLEHLAVETMLPYIVGGTNIWVEVCDSLGACSSGPPTTLELSPGEARTIDTLIKDIRSHARRCDFLLLQRQAIALIVTYTNTNQTEPLTTFKSALMDSLQLIDKSCTEMKYDQYSSFSLWLSENGINYSLT